MYSCPLCLSPGRLEVSVNGGPLVFHKSTQEFLDHGVKSDIFVQATSFLSIDLSIDKNWLFFILNWSFIRWSLIRWSLIRWSSIWWSLIRWSSIWWSLIRWSLIRWSLIQLFHGAKSLPPFILLRLFSSFLWYSVILQINVGPNKRSHKLWNSLSFLVTNIFWFS